MLQRPFQVAVCVDPVACLVMRDARNRVGHRKRLRIGERLCSGEGLMGTGHRLGIGANVFMEDMQPRQYVEHAATIFHKGPHIECTGQRLADLGAVAVREHQGNAQRSLQLQFDCRAAPARPKCGDRAGRLGATFDKVQKVEEHRHACRSYCLVACEQGHDGRAIRRFKPIAPMNASSWLTTSKAPSNVADAVLIA